MHQDFLPFSLALGGGAARGLAHIGVIRRLEELGAKASEVSGTSMGAIIAALYVLGYTSSEMQEVARNIKILKLIDLDMRHGLIKGKKIFDYLDILFRGSRFADTQIPLKIISTDIETGERVIFSEGKIIDAVRASISIPGVFMPYKYEGKNLVDGGLTENLPVSVLSRDHRVIAVTVQIEIVKRKKQKQNFFSKLWKNSIWKNGYNILRNTIAIMITQNEKRSIESRSDLLLIRPQSYEIDYYDISQVDAMIEAGYRETGEIEGFLSQE